MYTSSRCHWRDRRRYKYLGEEGKDVCRLFRGAVVSPDLEVWEALFIAFGATKFTTQIITIAITIYFTNALILLSLRNLLHKCFIITITASSEEPSSAPTSRSHFHYQLLGIIAFGQRNWLHNWVKSVKVIVIVTVIVIVIVTIIVKYLCGKFRCAHSNWWRMRAGTCAAFLEAPSSVPTSRFQKH